MCMLFPKLKHTHQYLFNGICYRRNSQTSTGRSQRSSGVRSVGRQGQKRWRVLWAAKPQERHRRVACVEGFMFKCCLCWTVGGDLSIESAISVDKNHNLKWLCGRGQSFKYFFILIMINVAGHTTIVFTIENLFTFFFWYQNTFFFWYPIQKALRAVKKHAPSNIMTLQSI